jgi:Secretion system C-terminal sorting domain/Putative flagellar system-associated repeat/F5/8 type C domain/Right handed beta helix region
MKKVLLVLFLTITFPLAGTTYYVSTDGNDSNPGTITQPWATWQYGFNHIAPGDLLYIRGGTYTPTVITTSHSRYSAVVVDGKTGSANSMYQVFAYPGETPVLDARNITGTSYERSGIFLYNSSYWHLKGLTVTRVDQPTSGAVGGQGILIQGVNSATHNTIENCVAHHIGGPGMGTRQYVNETLFLNCDSYSNWDAYSSSPGGNADGFDCGYASGDAIIRFTGCRSWLNGDDGFDLYQGSGYSGIYYLTNCWAWHMGYYPDGVTPGGDGSGFKYGQGQSSDGVVRRYSYNCISYDNMTQGFTQNEANIEMVFYNCVAYHNGVQGFDFQWNNVADILRNNISYNNGSSDIFQSNQTRDHNSWDSKVTVSSADFVSLDATQLALPRKADGSLPDISFLHLVSGSDLIDAGVDVGLPFSGKAPDIGAFETQTTSTVPTPPLFLSAVVENATPTLLKMTYDLALNNLIIPSISSFNVSVNLLPVTVNSVSISGNNVLLTLGSTIKSADIITVTYTKPSINPLQTVTGGIAASISAAPVTNNCQNLVKSNDPPVIMIDSDPTTFSGFVGEIDASGTYDLNNDVLTFIWTAPNNVSVSSISTPTIKFLAPIVNTAQIITFQLQVSDGKATVSKSIPMNILPYRPELSMAKIVNIDASSFQSTDYPDNINDNSSSTKWSAYGDNQWLILKLADPFRISHLMLSFLQGQLYESYFDIYASKDNLVWKPIFTREASCNFSGDMQVFVFPASDTSINYSYIKFIGHGNSSNGWNIISEFKIIGTAHPNPGSTSTNKNEITIYPNPANDFINISIEEPEIDPGMIRIIDLSGKIVSEVVLKPDVKNIKIPINLKSGLYVVKLLVGSLTLFSQRLIVAN